MLPALYQLVYAPPTDPAVHELRLPAGHKLRIAGEVEIAGDVSSTGTVSAADCRAGSVSLGGHIHTAPPGGGMTTSPL